MPGAERIRVGGNGITGTLIHPSPTESYVVEEFRRNMKKVLYQAKLILEPEELDEELKVHPFIEVFFDPPALISIGQKGEKNQSQDGNGFRLLESIKRVVLLRDGPYQGLIFFQDKNDSIGAFSAPKMALPSGEKLLPAE